jgi:hypothetical protein
MGVVDKVDVEAETRFNTANGLRNGSGPAVFADQVP